MEEKKSATIENNDLIKSVIYLKGTGILNESKGTVKFETVKEAEESIIDDIKSSIMDKLNSIKETVSNLQKDGTPLKLYSLKLIQVPMKINVWTATLNEKDLKSIVETLNNIEQKIKPLKLALEEKERNS